jgi:hypothetical protein
MTTDWIAIILSGVALGLSLYTLWVVRVSPFQLLVEPPAISLLNRVESSLALDLTFFNPGRTPAAILDMEITLCDTNGRAVSPPLKPRALHQTQYPFGGLTPGSFVISHFTSFTVKKGETVNKTVYFALSERNLTGKLWQDSSIIDTVRIAFKVNNRWNKRCFTCNYSEFNDYVQQRRTSSLMDLALPPRFFPDVKPLFLRGSIFDPVF